MNIHFMFVTKNVCKSGIKGMTVSYIPDFFGPTALVVAGLRRQTGRNRSFHTYGLFLARSGRQGDVWSHRGRISNGTPYLRKSGSGASNV